MRKEDLKKFNIESEVLIKVIPQTAQRKIDHNLSLNCSCWLLCKDLTFKKEGTNDFIEYER